MKALVLAGVSAALAASLLLLPATTCCGAPGDLYVADSSTGSIFKFTLVGDRNTFASGFFQPAALAFDREGNLFVADTGGGQFGSAIFKVAPDGTKSTFAEIGVNFYDMAFDGAGNLFVSDALEILKFAPDGTLTTFAPNLGGVWALAFDRLGNLYAAVNASGANSIMKFAPDGSGSTFVAFSGPGQGIQSMAFNSVGDLFAQRGLSILKITPAGEQSTFAPDYFRSLAFDTDGCLFAAKNAYNSSEVGIVKFAPDGTQTDFAMGDLFPRSMAVEPLTEKLRNISARGLVGTGDDVLIGGFIVGGNALANNAVIARAIGPSLTLAGVRNPLADPVLELHNASGAIVASNDDWEDDQETEISASGLAPTDPNESAIFATLPAGNFTAVVRGADDTTGVALVEVYSVGQ